MNSYRVGLPHAGSENHCDTTKSLKICYLFNTNQERVSIVPRFRTSMNWNDASTASGVERSESHTRLLNVLFGEWHSVYALVFVLEADILSSRYNKDDMMWHVWLFER